MGSTSAGSALTTGNGHEGPLAEFVALRQEMDTTQRHQQQTLVLQVTLSGAVFSFALSRNGLIGLLLIVPLSSYLFCARFMTHHRDIAFLGLYIRTELSHVFLAA